MSTPTVCFKNNQVRLIDQTKLPNEFKIIVCRDVKSLWNAIKRLSVRGAPAIGVAGAFGVLLGANSHRGDDPKRFRRHIQKTCAYLATSRPTAVNLFAMLERMQSVLDKYPSASVSRLKALLKKEAMAIYEEDRQACRQMGKHGARLIGSGHRVMTVCNAGALATVDYGTALGVMYSAKSQGKRFRVFVCETRPLLQGARLTAWELLRSKIDTTVICDNMAATLMKQKKVDAVFTGADRIAANGDTANKIGTYNLAVLAKHHDIPFYVVAPRSTFDLNLSQGGLIPIEERDKKEVSRFGRIATAPVKAKVYNPAFDVTDAKLIKAFVTEAGIIRPPFKKNIKKMFGKK